MTMLGSAAFYEGRDLAKRVDKLERDVVEWISAFDDLMAKYQELIHLYEELKRASDPRHRDAEDGTG